MKQRRCMLRRLLASALSAAMIGTMLPSAALAAQETITVPLLADFTFDNEASVLTGGNAKATVNGSYQLQDSKDAASGKALYLDGNAANYLAVTDSEGKSLLAGKKEITVSYDMKPDRTDTSWVFYAAPNTKAQAAPENYIGAFANGGNTKVERYKNGRTVAFTARTGNDWSHVDIVYGENTTSVYVNGVKAESVENSNAQLPDILGNSGIFYIGRANWVNGEGYKGWIDNFKIYDGALTDGQLVSEEAAANAVASDKAALTIPEEVTGDFTLPSKGASYTDITWTAEKKDCAVIGNDGYAVKVTRPEGDHVKVVFTATIELNGVRDTKAFTVTVKAQPNDKNVLADAVKALDIPNQDDIRGNVNLPSEVTVEGTDKKVFVTWKSSDKTVVTDADADGKAAGVVTRKAADTKVTMTATLTCGQERDSKIIVLNVKAAPKTEEKTDYLFAYFVNNGGPAEQQIFFASSHDGNNWMDLNKKEAVLSVADSVRTPEDLEKTQNQAGVRDPYLIRSPEGDKFYMIATDLCIGANNISAGTVDWGVSQFNGSHCLRIWESADLVNWSEPWLADVAPEGTTCAWAPEAIYDDVTGQYVVYWASMTGSVQKVYYSLTRDFKNFTKPAMFIDNGNDHIIDTTVVKDTTGNYYRGSAASGTIRIEKCTDTAQWLTNQSVWQEQGYIREIAGFSPNLEGPELFMYNQDDWKEVNGQKVATYGLLADNYGSRGYVPFYTTDIANAKWIQTPDNEYNFDTLHKRHGTVVSLTASEYDNIMKAYGPNRISIKTKPVKTTYETTDKQINGAGLVLTVTYKNGKTEDVSYNAGSKNARQFQFTGVDFSRPGEQEVTVTYGEQKATFTIEVKQGEEAEKKVLAQFDFDDENTGLTSNNAKASGTHTLTDSYNEANGKALYLNGGSDNYLTVTDKNGGSLLTGAKELTVSFETKPETASTNWPFYAAPNGDAPTYGKSEHYIGMLTNGGKITVERYNQNGNRPENPSAALSSSWTRVDVVMTAEKTSLYINGALQSEVTSAYKIEDILGNASILQIGKANWGSGEFYKGWIDNMTIRNYALTKEEVAEASADFVNTLPMVEGAVAGTAPTKEEAAGYRGTDNHTAIYTAVDTENKTLTPYVRKTADVTKIPVTLNLNGAKEILVNGKAFTNGSEMNLSEDVKITVKNTAGREETWTVKAAVVSNNPVLPGQYADPDIDYFDGRFWIFPTTDGYSGWSGTLFHAFSSKDMVNWEDEGVIMDLANNNPGLNEKGVQIAASPWASKNAWAPTIEEKDGKYYFYYCGNGSDGRQAIGVAVADNPAGPYVDKGEPLMTTGMCSAAGVSMGQAIDPSIFTDEDGRAYIMFGNGKAAMAELGEDMMSIKDGTLRQLNGLRDFRESPVVTKVGDKYHWTWSCDDTGSPNYHVNYGVSDNLDGNVTFVKTLLEKDESRNMLGTAHQSVLKITDVYGKERYFIAYHRFYTPLNIYTSGLGYHRETCIDEITFGEDGYMQVKPTLEGVSEVRVELDKSELEAEVENAVTDKEKYTEDTWKVYEEALKAAEEVLAEKEVGQTEIDEALEALKDAKTGLKEKPNRPFVDVDMETGDWYYNAVYYNFDRKIMNGVNDTHFEPTSNLARAQFAVILHNMEGKPGTAYEPKFKDVAESQWYTEAIMWASSKEIVTGYTDGSETFGWGNNILREQMAVMMYRYAKNFKEYDVTGSADFDKFEDAASVSEYAKEAMKWAVGSGIITGKYEGTRLDPQGYASRAECAIIMQRFLEKYSD